MNEVDRCVKTKKCTLLSGHTPFAVHESLDDVLRLHRTNAIASFVCGQGCSGVEESTIAQN